MKAYNSKMNAEFRRFLLPDEKSGKEKLIMSSDTIMLIFDIVILLYGVYAAASAVRMKKTGIPSAILLSKEESGRVRNAKEFCGCMYQPTLIFGVLGCLYGVVALLNQYVFRQSLIEIFGVVCFLIVCGWYVKELRKAKERYVP